MTLARYLLVQVVAYGLDIGGFYALYGSGVAEPIVANLCGKLAAGLFAFFAHRGFTFRMQGPKGRLRHALKYFILLALNAPISSAILAGLLRYTSYVTASKVLADVITVGLTFLLTKYVVFAVRNTADGSSASAPPRDRST